MELDLKAVAEFVKKADKEDLLDRVTVFRGEMEPAAVDLMENELWRRGVTPERVAAHDRERRAALVVAADGAVIRCAFCDRPAVSRRWGWHKLWGKVPLFPWPIPRCAAHDSGIQAGG